MIDFDLIYSFKLALTLYGVFTELLHCIDSEDHWFGE